MNAEELFWDLVEPMLSEPRVSRSTMMGLPCVRLDGRFFASLDRRTNALLVKLPRDRVGQLIDSGYGEPFAPAGRVFREWVALPDIDRRRWRVLLAEAREHAADSNTIGTPGAGAASGTAPASPGRPKAVAADDGFTGFGSAGIEFLAGLERDNSKAFFDAHREVYRRDLLEPSKAFVVELGGLLRERVHGRLRAEPKVGGSMFRIANDLRFSPGKPPYKPHLDFAFWQGTGGPRSDPSLMLRLSPTQVWLGCGVFALSSTPLRLYRNALADISALTPLSDQVDALMAAGAELSEPTRVRPPAGFAPDGPATRFAVRDGFLLMLRLPRPSAVTSAAFVDWCADRLAPFAPVHEWFVEHCGAPSS